MGVYDNVRGHACLSEGHIDLRPKHREHAFLAVPGTELVADDRVTRVPDCVPNTNVALVFLIAH